MGFQPSLRDLDLLPFADPALKRWAIFGRPCGTGALRAYVWDMGFQSSLRYLRLLPFADPALKRRAIFSRPSGTCTCYRLPTRR